MTPFIGFQLHSPGIGDGVGGADPQRGECSAADGGTGTGLVTGGVDRGRGTLGGEPAHPAEHQGGRGDRPGGPGRAIGSRRFGQPGRRSGFRVFAGRQNPIMRLHRDDPLTDVWNVRSAQSVSITKLSDWALEGVEFGKIWALILSVPPRFLQVALIGRSCAYRTGFDSAEKDNVATVASTCFLISKVGGRRPQSGILAAENDHLRSGLRWDPSR